MSKPRLQLTAVIDTAAHADTIITSIRTQLAGKDIFEEHKLARGTDPIDGKIRIRFDFRFNSSVDRDDVRNWLRDQVRDHPVVKNWIEKVKLTRHTCSHDDAEVRPCTETDYVIDFER